MSFLNLKNFWLSIKHDRFLLLALLVGLLLRGLNSTFGSPSLYISNDEAIAHLSAFNMIAAKTPVSIANYTPLGAYLQIPFLFASYLAIKILGYVQNVSDFELFILTHEGYFLFIPRLISAFFGTLTILVVYKTTLYLFQEKQAAILAAFLTAVSFNLVHISHLGRPWSPALFFMTASVYFALRRQVFLSFITCATAYGFHQSGILIMPLILLLTNKVEKFKILYSFLFFTLIVFILSLLTLRAGLIDSVKSGQSFLRSGELVVDVISKNFSFPGSVVNTVADNLSLYFLENFLITDGIILIFGILGLSLSYGKNKKLFLFIACYFFFASLFFHPLIRYLLPIYILLIPFSGYALLIVSRRNGYLIPILILLASINSLWWNYLYLKKPSFIQAREWLIKNINSDVPIAYTGTRYRMFLPNSESIAYTQIFRKDFYSELFKFGPSNSMDNVRNIVYTSVFPGDTKLDKLNKAIGNYHIVYVVDYYIDPSERLYDLDPGKFNIVAHFNPVINDMITGIPEPLFDSSWNFPINDNRPKLSMYSLSNTGPYFEILKIKNY